MPVRVAWNSRKSQYPQWFSLLFDLQFREPWGQAKPRSKTPEQNPGAKPRSKTPECSKTLCLLSLQRQAGPKSWAEEDLKNYCPGSQGGGARSLPGGDVRLPGDGVSEISTKTNEISRLCLAEWSGIGENLNISKVLQHFLISSSASRFGLRFPPHNAKS